MGRKRKAKADDFKQVKIKVGKRLPKNANVTQPNFKSGSIMIRPQMPMQDIENLDEVKRQTYKSYLKQLSHHNAKKQAEAANKLKAFINGDKSYKELYSDTLVELMRTYATINNTTNKAMLELASVLFGKMTKEEFEPHAKRVWLCVSIGLTDLLSIKQQTSIKMLFVVIDQFSIALFQDTKNISFLLELINLTEKIPFDKIELIKRINHIFISYLDEKNIKTTTRYVDDFNSSELSTMNKFCEKLIDMIKQYVCPNNDYFSNIGLNYEMSLLKTKNEVSLLTDYINIGFTTIRNLYLFINKLYYAYYELENNSYAFLSQQIDNKIISELKNQFPISVSDVTPSLFDKITPINMSYCFIICDMQNQISTTSRNLILSNIFSYLLGIFQMSKNSKNWSSIFNKGLSVMDEIMIVYYKEGGHMFYGGKLSPLIIEMVNPVLVDDLNENDRQNLLKTLVIIFKRLDFSQFKQQIAIFDSVKKLVTLVESKFEKSEGIVFLDFLYYCSCKCPTIWGPEERKFYNCLAMDVADKIPDLIFYEVALKFINLKDTPVIVYFLKYCISYMFNCTTVQYNVGISICVSALLDILSKDSEKVALLGSFLFTCSVGFTSSESVIIKEMVVNNKEYFDGKPAGSILPVEEILQRSEVFIDIKDIYMDSVQHKVKQWLNENPHCCHVNLCISFIYINKWANELIEYWPIEQIQLLVDFLAEFSTVNPDCGKHYLNSLRESIRCLLFTEQSELPETFLEILGKELDSAISNKDEDLYRLENIFTNLLGIFEKRVFPSSLKSLLSKKLKDVKIDSSILENILDQVVLV